MPRAFPFTVILGRRTKAQETRLVTLVLKRLLPTIYLPAGYSQQSGVGTKYQLNAAASYTVLNGLATGSWGIDTLLILCIYKS